MDNLTHSLVGALIGQAGLKRRTGLAMPAMVIGANLPDIDAACFFWLEGTGHLGFRRGITHGPIAWVLLPLLLAGALWWFDRWQSRRGTRPDARQTVRFGWLWGLSLIAFMTHPALDWLNVYGIRLLEPVSSKWFYGDTLFIIDVWLWAGMGLALWLSLRREKSGGEWRGPARAALAATGAYIAVNGAISAVAVTTARSDVPYPETVVANPVPALFWRRELLWRSEGRYGAMDYSAFGGITRRPTSAREGKPIGMDDPRVAPLAARNRDARAFLFWSRMPVAEGGGDSIVIRDQRFLHRAVSGGFSVELGAPE